MHRSEPNTNKDDLCTCTKNKTKLNTTKKHFRLFHRQEKNNNNLTPQTIVTGVSETIFMNALLHNACYNIMNSFGCSHG